MSYRGFGPASPYRKGIEFIARRVVNGAGRHSMPIPQLQGMLEAMTGRSIDSIANDVDERITKLREERADDEMPRP